MDLNRKTTARLGALEAEIENCKTIIARGIALIASPLSPPHRVEIEHFLSDLDQLEQPFRRAARSLEFELRRTGAFIPLPSGIHSGPLVNRIQHRARRTLRAWHPMREVIELAMQGKEDGLLPEWHQGMANTQIDALANAFVMVDQILNSTDQDAAAEALGAYRDIPMLPHLFMAMMHAAWRVKSAESWSEPLQFLDVGSGRGTTLLMASRFFPTVHGIELDPGYHEHACKLLNTDRTIGCSSINANALEFEDYGNYDIIYFYKPISDIDRLVEMEARIVAQAKPGTLLIAPYLGFEDRHSPHDINKVDWHIYQRNGAEADGKQLNEAVRWIGPFVQHPDTVISSKTCGHWAPLVRALAARGYRPSSLD